MSVLGERVKAHLESLSDQVLEVPEWGEDGQALRIHFRPLTLHERQQLYPYASKGDLSYLARVIILKARDEAGAPLFGKEDRTLLQFHAVAAVVERVANVLLGAETVAGEKAVDEGELGN